MPRIKRRKVSLEEEKRYANELWADVMKDAANGIINKQKINAAIVRCNMVDYTLIEESRRDLLG